MRDFDVSLDESDGIDALTGTGKTFSIVTHEQYDGYVLSKIGGKIVKEVHEDGTVLRYDSDGHWHGKCIWFDGEEVEFNHGVMVEKSYFIDSVDKFGDFR